MISESSFAELFTPGYIGRLRLKNRIIMAPMGTGFSDLDGRFSWQDIEYYAERAKGGVGLIIPSGAMVARIAPGLTPMLMPIPRVDSHRLIARMSELVRAIHDFGASIALQMAVGPGRQCDLALPEDPPVSASALPAQRNPNVICRELTTKEVKEIVKAFGDAAERAALAGFDAIEIHGHTGYLLDEFMTSIWNKRTDEYGGDLDGRLRFPLELVSTVKHRLGQDFPLMFRLTVDHKIDGGRTLPESQQIAKRLAAAGVDAIDCDLGCYDAMHWFFPPQYIEEGAVLEIYRGMKQAVEIPVIGAGALSWPEVAEKALREGILDFVASGRGLLADPYWPEKARRGQLKDIRRCIMCNVCIERRLTQRPISCSVNPATGREKHYRITPTEEPKKVIVVGGGPAGMQAAVVASQRGHKVRLYEKTSRLGGQLLVASQPSFKRPLTYAIEYLRNQLEELNINVNLGIEVTPEIIKELNPDVVIIATGAAPLIPDIPGANGSNVTTAVDVLAGVAKTEQRIVVVGGNATGCETAAYLAAQGKVVTVVEMLSELARDIYIANRLALLEILRQTNVSTRTDKKVVEIGEQGVTIEDKQGNRQILDADTVVLALGLKPEKKLAAALIKDGWEIICIGDCDGPGNVSKAIYEGYVAGWRI